MSPPSPDTAPAAAAGGDAPRPTLAHFTYDPQLPMDEIAPFYSVLGRSPPAGADRPYVWCNSLVTLDGYLSFLEPGDTGVHGVAMKKRFPKCSSADFRLLHTGWAHSDAILVTAAELRNEPEAQIRVLFDDLIDHRQRVLGKPGPQPHLVVVTRGGDLPASHPVFNPPPNAPTARARVIVATTTKGQGNLPSFAQATNPPEVHVFDDAQATGVDFPKLLAHLKHHCGVAHVDVGAGGDVIQQMLLAKLIDEMRLTLAAQLAGAVSSTGAMRPHFFPVRQGKHWFTHDTAPHMAIEGVRVVANRMIMIRMRVEYRH